MASFYLSTICKAENNVVQRRRVEEERQRETAQDSLVATYKTRNAITADLSPLYTLQAATDSTKVQAYPTPQSGF